jgi:hypothetical protein
MLWRPRLMRMNANDPTTSQARGRREYRTGRGDRSGTVSYTRKFAWIRGRLNCFGYMVSTEAEWQHGHSRDTRDRAYGSFAALRMTKGFLEPREPKLRQAWLRPPGASSKLRSAGVAHSDPAAGNKRLSVWQSRNFYGASPSRLPFPLRGGRARGRAVP